MFICPSRRRGHFLAIGMPTQTIAHTWKMSCQQTQFFICDHTINPHDQTAVFAFAAKQLLTTGPMDLFNGSKTRFKFESVDALLLLHFLLNGQPVHLSILVNGAKSVDLSIGSFENKVFVTREDSSWFLWSCVNVDWFENRGLFLVPSRIDPRHRDWFENRRFCSKTGDWFENRRFWFENCEMSSFVLTTMFAILCDHELDGAVLANDVN